MINRAIAEIVKNEKWFCESVKKDGEWEIDLDRTIGAASSLGKIRLFVKDGKIVKTGKVKNNNSF